MPTIQQMQQFIRQQIQEAYPEPEAGAIAQLVLEHVLQQSRVQLSLNKGEPVAAAEVQKIEAAVARLRRQEPVQYVLGGAHFFGLELLVDERVLIPRPETEELVNLVLQRHRQQAGLQVLDICTGSGCIPLALAANLTNATVYGLEVSEGALEVAKANAGRYNLPVTWLHQDIFLPVTAMPEGSVDVITSNPPYVLEDEKQQMRPNVLEFEPHLALFVPDTEALKYYTRITEVAQRLLKQGGALYFEINERYGHEVKALMLASGFSDAAIVQDLFGKDRIVYGVK